jgi:GntR family transcriptional regulator
VIPFRIQFENGISIFEQVVYAAKKAMIAGQLRPGDSFPSVRSLSKELKINPNTAHKIVTHLIAEGLLETRPGIGTVVATPPNSTSKERAQLLVREVEALVLEAKRLGIMQEDLVTAVGTQWDKLSRKDAPSKLQPTYGGSKPR